MTIQADDRLQREAIEHSGRYEVVKRIGDGGMGVVYLVHDRDLDERCAVKTIRGVSREEVRTIKREFRTLLGVRHQNIVRLRELQESKGVMFYTMDYIHGLTLASYLIKLGFEKSQSGKHRAVDESGTLFFLGGRNSVALKTALPPTERREGDDIATYLFGAGTREAIAASTEPEIEISGEELEKRTRVSVRGIGKPLNDIISALQFLHTNGRIHCDIKPSNIMVRRDGTAVLLDFGVTLHGSANVSQPLSVKGGTRGFIAPEAVRYGQVTSKADWYSLGVSLYRIYGSRHLARFAQDSALHNTGQLPLRALNPAVPEWLDAVVDGMLDRDPASRFDGTQVREILRQATGQGGATSPAISVESSAPARAGAFVGRTNELSALEAGFSAASERFVNLYVSGPPGAGKSALVRRAISQHLSENRESVVLYGRCRPQEMIAWRGLDEVAEAFAEWLGSVPESERQQIHPEPVDARRIARIFPNVPFGFDVSGTTEPASAGPAERRRAFAAFWRMLDRAAGFRRLIVVIEDIHNMDAEARGMLEYLFRGRLMSRGAIVLIRRGSESQARASLEASGVRRAKLLPLGPLSRENIGEWLRNSDIAEGNHERFLAQAMSLGGLPGSLNSLENWYATEGQRSLGQGTGLSRYREYLTEKFNDDEQALLNWMIRVRGGAPEGLLAILSGVAPDICRDSLANLERHGVASLVGATSSGRVWESAPHLAALLGRTDGDPQAHRQIVRAATRGDALLLPLDTIIEHQLAAGDVAAAREAAVIAAARASEGRNYGRALQLLRFVRQELGEPDHEIESMIAAAASTLGQSSEAGEWYERAAAHSGGVARMDALIGAAKSFADAGNSERALDVAERLRHEAGIRSHHSFVTRMRHLFGRRRVANTITRFAPADSTPRDRDYYRKISVRSVLAMELSQFDTAEAQYQAGVMLREAGEVGDQGNLTVAASALIICLGREGIRAERTRSETSSALEQMLAAFPDQRSRVWYELAEGVARYYLGDFGLGARLVSSARAWLEKNAAHEDYLIRLCQLTEFNSAIYTGELDVARRDLTEFVDEARFRGDENLVNRLTVSFNWTKLLANDVRGAKHTLRDVRAEAPTGDTTYLERELLLAEAEVELYQHKDALSMGVLIASLTRSLSLRDAVDSQLPRARTLFMIGRVHAAMAGLGKDEVRNLRAALAIADRLRREDVPYARTWASALQTAVHDMRQETQEAWDSAETTLDLARADGLMLLHDCIEHRLFEWAGRKNTHIMNRSRNAHVQLRKRGAVKPAQFRRVYLPQRSGAPREW